MQIKLEAVNKRKYLLVSYLFLFLYTIISAQKNNIQELKSKEFEPDNISTEAVEYGITFSSSGGAVLYFAKSNHKWGSRNMKSFIYYSEKKSNGWSKPKLASFSGEHDDSDPHLTNDGKILYFISDRPSKGNQPTSADIWFVEKDENGNWKTPIRLKSPVNSEETEWSPKTDKKGNLYFASNRPDGYGQGDLYMAKREKDGFDLPVNLGKTINSSQGEWNLEINDKGNLIIFEASGRTQNLSPYGDLYISFKKKNQWTVPQSIKEINTTGSDLNPHLSMNEKVLYYTSSDSLKSTNTDIYFLEFKNLFENYKRRSVLPEK